MLLPKDTLFSWIVESEKKEKEKEKVKREQRREDFDSINRQTIPRFLHFQRNNAILIFAHLFAKN